jgi:hypothetical protein
MKSRNVIASSLDMLLDTMCNTFGGVCFIALLVSVISVSLPPDRSGDADAAAPSAVDPRVAQLVRQRNRLAESIKSLETQLAGMTNVTDSTTLAETEAKIAVARSRADAAERENERRRGEAGKARGEAEAQNARAAELNDLIAALEAEIKDPKYVRARIVRVPHERQLYNYKTRNVLLYHGDFYDLNDENAVSVAEGRSSITFSVRHGRGTPLSEEFVKGPVWRRVLDQTISSTIIRIYTDRASAEGLSILVQDLASRRRPYNWRYNDGGESITFVEGNDTFVQ